MVERAEDHQISVLRAYTVLCSLQPDWRGALIVSCGLGSGGSALSVAANIAGAGCLAIDERPEACRAAMRSGACDFVVNTVDEALRVLKNEIRQRKPVSVGLTMAPTAALEELLDRGVLPQLFTAFRPDAESTGLRTLHSATFDRAARRFAAFGSLIVDSDQSFLPSAGVIDAEARLNVFTREHGLHLESFALASAEELRALDDRLMEMIPATDPRHRWCSAAPRFFHRERPYRRAIFLTEKETRTLRSK
jgi:urocanate hydratase